MSELLDTVSNIRAKLKKLADGCPQENLSQHCRDSLEDIAVLLDRTEKLADWRERRYELIDDLYYSVGSKLNSTFDTEEILQIILDSLKSLTGFDAAGIFLVNHRTGDIEAEVSSGYQERQFSRVRQKVGEGILGWVIEHRETQNVPDVTEDPRYISARADTRSEAAVPMIAENRVLGCINLESNRLNAFSQEDIHLLETYATQATLAVERARLQREIWEKKRLEEEVNLARNIQASLLPGKKPEIPGFELAGMNVPSSEVGGDYYDYIPIPTGGMGLAIADVAGKGIAASLTMSGFRAALRGEIRHNLQPHQVMHKVNHFVLESTDIGSFVTAFYGILIGNRFSYVNAGHNPPILLRNNGEHEILESGGMVLGIDEEQYFEQGAVEIDPGDLILFYTDGVTEAFNPEEEEFGVDRLFAALKETKGLPVEEIIQSIYRQVRKFARGSKGMDDMTIMLLRGL